MTIDAQNNKNQNQYLFDGRYQDQLKSALQNGSLAFRLYSKKIASGEEGKSLITLDKYLLPEHCKLELIANALTSLEKHPENTQLLNALGEYTKNSRYEQKWYSKMGTGMGKVEYKALFNLVAVGLLPVVVGIALFSLPVGLIAAAACLVTAAAFYANRLFNGSIALGIGRFLKSLVGAKQELANLSELEDKLNAGINENRALDELMATPKVEHQVSNGQSNEQRPFSPLLEELAGEPMVSSKEFASNTKAPSSSAFFGEPREAKEAANNTPDHSPTSTNVGYTFGRGG